MESFLSFIEAAVAVRIENIAPIGMIGVIAIFSLTYFALYLPTISFFRSELKKRKLILSKVEDYKNQYAEKADNGVMDKVVRGSKMNNLLNFKTANYSEKYFKDLESIVSEQRPKPMWAFAALSFQVLVFLSFLTFFLTQSTLPESTIYVVAPLGVMTFLFWGRKYLWLKIIFGLFMAFIYVQLTAEAILFVTSVLLFRLVHKLIEDKKKEQ